MEWKCLAFNDLDWSVRGDLYTTNGCARKHQSTGASPYQNQNS